MLAAVHGRVLPSRTVSNVLIGGEGRRRQGEWRVAGEREHFIIERNYHHNPWNVGTACDQLIKPSEKDALTDPSQVERCRVCVVVTDSWAAKGSVSKGAS